MITGGKIKHADRYGLMKAPSPPFPEFLYCGPEERSTKGDSWNTLFHVTLSGFSRIH